MSSVDKTYQWLLFNFFLYKGGKGSDIFRRKFFVLSTSNKNITYVFIPHVKGIINGGRHKQLV